MLLCGKGAVSNRFVGAGHSPCHRRYFHGHALLMFDEIELVVDLDSELPLLHVILIHQLMECATLYCGLTTIAITREAASDLSNDLDWLNFTCSLLR